MLGSECYEDHLRELGYVHRDGRRYAKYHLVAEGWLTGAEITQLSLL